MPVAPADGAPASQAITTANATPKAYTDRNICSLFRLSGLRLSGQTAGRIENRRAYIVARAMASRIDFCARHLMRPVGEWIEPAGANRHDPRGCVVTPAGPATA